MAKVSDLPVDVFSIILEYLGRHDYHDVIRASKSFYKEALPYLYRDIKFEATKSRSCARKLALLLRTVLERPQLTSYVRIFRLRGPLPYWTKYNPWPEDAKVGPASVNLWGLKGCTTLSNAQKIFASNQIFSFVDESMHKETEQFKNRSKDALATLVLTRFTELRTLDLGDGFLMHSLFLPQILKRADRLFPKLDHVALGDKRFDPENPVSYMDLDLIRPIFYSDTVRTFEYLMTQPWQLTWNRPAPPRSESLTMLRLFRTNITRGTLDQLLHATPHLKRFHYDQEILFNANTPTAPPLSPYLNLDGLNIALANLKNTLEECKLSLSLAPGSLSSAEIKLQGLQFPPMQGTLAVLKDMQHLVTVEVPMMQFLGWAPDFAASLSEVLPWGIRRLTLRDDFLLHCPWATGPAMVKKIGRIAEYLEGRGVHAPQLSQCEIRIKPSAKDSTWLEDGIRDVGMPMAGSNVVFGVEKEKRADVWRWRFGEGIGKERDLRIDSAMVMRKSFYLPLEGIRLG
ncbi:hypothetical protein BU23DRAFT_336823 [Bimuria novae-zelandiae CBS 107.79]|uniref:F-box domain-containing protein n=1 Tax=Bimuria novae-zelandiae CBS 107.79 TaxID=1447943 RepID=A0A6A5ULP4_9PLEO|nr:hypothetical protein BU23DRAFT_336823 [Bimuria novae-zelandiae CBS 107.79]